MSQYLKYTLLETDAFDCALFRDGGKPPQREAIGYRPSGDVTWVWQSPINIVSGLGVSHNRFLSISGIQTMININISLKCLGVICFEAVSPVQ